MCFDIQTSMILLFHYSVHEGIWARREKALAKKVQTVRDLSVCVCVCVCVFGVSSQKWSKGVFNESYVMGLFVWLILIHTLLRSECIFFFSKQFTHSQLLLSMANKNHTWHNYLLPTTSQNWIVCNEISLHLWGIIMTMDLTVVKAEVPLQTCLLNNNNNNNNNNNILFYKGLYKNFHFYCQYL